ncbi:hypothetical protein [Pseudopontixanthobacter vadosimaris]|uniref:hypothetical protein n=1 Tax=Pseudopontixanthobacter vadosimaris TaxID=2726450 RepID=UPI0014731D5A|nr:hypothetical protein [Pseudopontixanthobacter vadosimaris]
MSEASFASLSPTLLARKGGARPAMRPQLTPLIPGRPANLEDLGWNDMGDQDDDAQSESEVVQLTPAPANPEAEAEARANDREADAALADKRAKNTPPAVHRQRDEIAARINAAEALPKTPAAQAASPAPQEPAPVNGRSEAADLPRNASAVLCSVRPAPSRQSAASRGKRAAFTLRLDAERHLKLRLASTITNCSAQQIVTDALDAMLGDMPELDTLAAQLQRHNKP